MFSKRTAALPFLLLSISLAAQNPAPRVPGGSPRQQPCWQQAGLQKSVALELASLQRETHSQIEQVCTNTSLTPQQKHQQVQEIHEQMMQKVEGMITPDQKKTLMECHQARSMNHGAAARGGVGGGCGGAQSASAPASNSGNPKPVSEGASSAEDESSPEN